jgi:hypothetical protein
MVELRVADASFRRTSVTVTVIAFAAVAGLAYWYERGHRRWAAQNHPLAATRARLERSRANYWEKRAIMTDIAQVISQAGLPVPRTTRPN